MCNCPAKGTNDFLGSEAGVRSSVVVLQPNLGHVQESLCPCSQPFLEIDVSINIDCCSFGYITPVASRNTVTITFSADCRDLNFFVCGEVE